MLLPTHRGTNKWRFYGISSLMLVLPQCNPLRVIYIVVIMFLIFAHLQTLKVVDRGQAVTITENDAGVMLCPLPTYPYLLGDVQE